MPSRPSSTHDVSSDGDKVSVGLLAHRPRHDRRGSLFCPRLQSASHSCSSMPATGLTRRAGADHGGSAGCRPSFNDKEVTVVAKKKQVEAAPTASGPEKAEVTQPARRKVQRLSFKERTLLVQV